MRSRLGPWRAALSDPLYQGFNDDRQRYIEFGGFQADPPDMPDQRQDQHPNRPVAALKIAPLAGGL